MYFTNGNVYWSVVLAVLSVRRQVSKNYRVNVFKIKWRRNCTEIRA